MKSHGKYDLRYSVPSAVLSRLELNHQDVLGVSLSRQFDVRTIRCDWFSEYKNSFSLAYFGTVRKEESSTKRGG
jgi:hypothetical protein